jgi:HEPN domain-containing protein
LPNLPEPGSPADWLRYARSDLALARIECPAEVFFETLCLHTQQAVEKSLKAVLLWKGIRLLYTHNLAELITLVREARIPWPVELDQAAELTVYAAQTRYPGDFEPVSAEEHRRSISVAEQVLAWAQRLIEEGA